MIDINFISEVFMNPQILYWKLAPDFLDPAIAKSKAELQGVTVLRSEKSAYELSVEISRLI